jgi:hypothetical protein
MGNPDLADDIRALLAGIDKTECENDQGWWETSAGAEGGAATLAKVLELARVAQATIDRYHWLCAHLTQIHVETTQPAGSPADTPMRVTLMQVWPDLPRTDAASADEAVTEAMKEGA